MSAAVHPTTARRWRRLKMTLLVLACILAAPLALFWVMVTGLSREAR